MSTLKSNLPAIAIFRDEDIDAIRLATCSITCSMSDGIHGNGAAATT
jgi:hypothetical protein